MDLEVGCNVGVDVGFNVGFCVGFEVSFGLSEGSSVVLVKDFWSFSGVLDTVAFFGALDFLIFNDFDFSSKRQSVK